MDKDLLRNGSGYVDPSAYSAIKNYMKEENRMEMEYSRGDIYEYEMVNRAETKKALVVSADFRANDYYLNIIILTDEPKGNINVPIVCGGMMYADCGMVSFATKDRFGRFVRTARAEEMAQIDEGIAKCLGIEQKVVEKVVEVPTIPAETLIEITPDGMRFDIETAEVLAAARAEANIYKNLYEQLLVKMIG